MTTVTPTLCGRGRGECIAAALPCKPKLFTVCHAQEARLQQVQHWQGYVGARAVHPRSPQPDVPQYDEKTGAVKYPNATDIQRHLMTDEACSKKYHPNTIRRDLKFMKKDWKLPIKYDEAKHGFHYTKCKEKLPFISANEATCSGCLCLLTA